MWTWVSRCFLSYPHPIGWRHYALMHVWRLSVMYIGPKSRTERPRKTKIGTEVAHVTRDSNTTFKVKRSKVNLQGAGAYWSKGWWRLQWQLYYWSYKSCKAPVKSSPSTNQHPVFLQAGCPSCCPTNSVRALKGKISHSTESTGGLPTLSLTANSSWLPGYGV